MILTDVPARASAASARRAEEEIRELTADEAEALLPELAEGSMRPKLEAAVDFARATGRDALITSAAALAEALEGRAAHASGPSELGAAPNRRASNQAHYDTEGRRECA